MTQQLSNTLGRLAQQSTCPFQIFSGSCQGTGYSMAGGQVVTNSCRIAQGTSPPIAHIANLLHSRRILRLVDVLPDKGHHVGRTIDAGQASVEDDLGYPRGCLNLDLQDVRLRREEHPQLQLLRDHLVGDGTCGHPVGRQLLSQLIRENRSPASINR